MTKPFLNYLAMPTRVPLRVWHMIRFVSIAALAAVAVMGFVDSADALTLFWGIVIPILPLVFLVAPGAWRNVCPLAALNQTPRNTGLTKSLAPPRWLRDFG